MGLGVPDLTTWSAAAPAQCRLKTSRILDLPPSCLQFSRLHPAFVVVGTYNLQTEDPPPELSRDEPDPRGGEDGDEEGSGDKTKRPQNRNGSLVVFRLDDDNLIHLQTMSQPSAILDLRFHPGPDPELEALFAVVSSTGTLAVFRLDTAPGAPVPLRLLATSRCQDLADDILFLQCDWHPVHSHLIAVTTSNGLARLLVLDDDWKIKSTVDLGIRNSLEAWSIAFSPPADSCGDDSQGVHVYCGGDDATMRYVFYRWNVDGDGRTSDHVGEPLLVKGEHQAGVTAILPLPLHAPDRGRIVVTGSYDDHLRVFVLAELQPDLKPSGGAPARLAADCLLGGGVWRLVLLETSQSPVGESSWARILASCMHAGPRIVEIRSEDGLRWSCRILARFEKHESMNYASDWAASTSDGGWLCLSTSFYDRLMCLWESGP